MSVDIIQTQYDRLAAVAQRYAQQAEAVAVLQQQVERSAQALRQRGWEGRGAAAFGAEMDNVVLPVMHRLHAAFIQAQTVTLKIAEVIRQAEEEAAEPFKVRDHVSVPTGVAAAAGGAAIAVAGVAGGMASDAAAGGGGDRGPSGGSRRDERNSRRVEERATLDERWRRPPGGDRGGVHTDYDWAGGAILERYLTGGGDWNIDNDPLWTQYMQQNAILTGDLRDRAVQDAQAMAASGQTTMTINQQYAMEIENGEGIVGYQYLHGTNADVGGFQRRGTATMVPDGSGGTIVTMKMHYTWNDVIDPNPQYVTDTWKSRFAEFITLGKADPYVVHIGWYETTAWSNMPAPQFLKERRPRWITR